MNIEYLEHLPDKVVNHSGEVFNNLTVVRFVGWKIYKPTYRRSLWEIKCHCGKVFESLISNVISGSTRSCGCTKLRKLAERNTKHGCSGSRTLTSFEAMLRRCHYTGHKDFHKYGGAGITVCDRWREPAPKGFLNFLGDMGERPEGSTINRIKGAKTYSKETCEWATYSVQGYDQKKKVTNTSGRTGVNWIKARSTWQATINVEKERIYLGSFKDYGRAVKAREAAEVKYYGYIKE